MLNSCGPTILPRWGDETGAGLAALAGAYVVVREIFDLDSMRDEIDAMAGTVSGLAHLALYGDIQDVLNECIVWFGRNVPFVFGGTTALVARFRSGVRAVSAAIPQVLSPEASTRLASRVAAFQERGIPAPLAVRVAVMRDLVSVPDIILVSEQTETDVAVVAATYFAIAGAVGFDDLLAAAREITTDDEFDLSALERTVANLGITHRRLTAGILQSGGCDAAAFESWNLAHGDRLSRVRAAVLNALASSRLTLSRIAVAAALLDDLCQSVQRYALSGSWPEDSLRYG